MIEQIMTKQTVIGMATDKLHAAIDEANQALTSLEVRISHALFNDKPEGSNGASEPSELQVDAVAPISGATDRIKRLTSNISSLVNRIGI